MVLSPRLGVAIAAFGCALLLEGCGGGASTTKAPGTTTAPKPSETTTAKPKETTTHGATTTTTPVDPDCVPVKGKLPSCLCQKGYVSKCTASTSPGACFTASGSKDTWACWSPEQSKTDAECKQDGQAGACEYVGHVKTYEKPGNVPACEKVKNFKSQCNPPQDHWGACFDSSDQWLPIADDNTKNMYMNGDCQTQASIADTTRAFTGICRFETQAPQEFFKCDTVPTYKAGSCGSNKAACFSTSSGVTWACSTKSGLPKNCVTQPIDSSKGRDTWEGACLIKGADGYDKAKKWNSTVLVV